MDDYRRHIILSTTTIREALQLLNALASDAILFVCDSQENLMGSLTDGDVRRGLLNGSELEDLVTTIIQPNPKFFCSGVTQFEDLLKYREENFRIIPILKGNSRKITGVINFRKQISYVPVDVMIMAGGKGMRLRPLTDTVPKPMLKLGEKPIIQYSIEHFKKYGVVNFWISVNYLADQIMDYFGKGVGLEVGISYVKEDAPMGTIGSCAMVKDWQHDVVVICNADVLTNVDLERWYLHFLRDSADVSIISIPYTVSIPYAVLEMKNEVVSSIKEKPDYTYLANGGFYMMKRELLEQLNTEYTDAPDFIEGLMQRGLKITSFPHPGFWLDIGRVEDYERAKVSYHSILDAK
jgi:dTDP-glucose pyrophosphorylase